MYFAIKFKKPSARAHTTIHAKQTVAGIETVLRSENYVFCKTTNTITGMFFKQLFSAYLTGHCFRCERVCCFFLICLLCGEFQYAVISIQHERSFEDMSIQIFRISYFVAQTFDQCIFNKETKRGSVLLSLNQFNIDKPI